MPREVVARQLVTVRAYVLAAAMLHSLFMKTLGQFIVERRKELGLAGREVVAEVRNSDGKPISIPFLVDLEHDRRKPSDEVLEQLAKVLKVDSDMLYFFGGKVSSRPHGAEHQQRRRPCCRLEGLPA